MIKSEDYIDQSHKNNLIHSIIKLKYSFLANRFFFCIIIASIFNSYPLFHLNEQNFFKKNLYYQGLKNLEDELGYIKKKINLNSSIINVENVSKNGKYQSNFEYEFGPRLEQVKKICTIKGIFIDKPPEFILLCFIDELSNLTIFVENCPESILYEILVQTLEPKNIIS